MLLDNGDVYRNDEVVAQNAVDISYGDETAYIVSADGVVTRDGTPFAYDGVSISASTYSICLSGVYAVMCVGVERNNAHIKSGQTIAWNATPRDCSIYNYNWMHVAALCSVAAAAFCLFVACRRRRRLPTAVVVDDDVDDGLLDRQKADEEELRETNVQLGEHGDLLTSKNPVLSDN